MLTLARGRLLPGDGERASLDQGWRLCATAPGAVDGPSALTDGLPWMDAPVLGPVAAVLRERGEWSLDGAPRRFDDQDWWYELRFDAPAGFELSRAMLNFDGLATLAEVWLNGEPVLQSSDMFMAHEVHAGGLLRAHGNVLHMVFRSLDRALTQRRPRPRWRAPMIENQQIRWMRTTLLGRTPGWSPPAAAVGPWRGVWLSAARAVDVSDVRIRTEVQGRTARLHFSCHVKPASGGSPEAAAGAASQGESRDSSSGSAAEEAAKTRQVTLRLERDGRSHAVALTREPVSDERVGAAGEAGEPDAAAQAERWSGVLTIEDVALWWPHTHGDAALYQATLAVHDDGQGEAAEPRILAACGQVGFRTVAVARDHDGKGFRVHINGVPVFCRGACWTPIDPVTLDAPSHDHYAQAVAQVRAAGMNMIRLGGTMTYEADAFYDECDRQGVMVWQDFMFANMDYPEDAGFTAMVQQEVRQQMARWQGRPSLAVLCGNSEVEQQAAMFGATRDRWSPALFHGTLAAEAAAACPDVPYWPSSAHGGAFPHQGDEGTTSYYGVGAYLRGFDDARRSGLRFATECLAFANPPEAAALAAMPGGLGGRMHHPAWKQRTPRDLGAGWDFEDVRDHYLRELFEVDPARLRYSDHDRYLALGRVAVGEAMAAAYAEWRRAGSPCGGALIWFLRDLWPGAGWGVIDSLGQPKAPYFYLKRALQPIAVSLTDEGNNGYHVHVVNDGPVPLVAELEITALRQGAVQVGQARAAIEVPAHGARSWPLLTWFEWFADWSWSYRFGPASAQVVAVALKGAGGALLSEAHAFPTGMALPLERDPVLQATWQLTAPGCFEVEITAARFAQAVHFDVDACVAEDAYFHLAPGQTRRVRLRATTGAVQALSGAVRALNADAPVTIRPRPPAAASLT